MLVQKYYINDGNTWYELSQPAAHKLRHLCICQAFHDLRTHKPYSIPDVLRMNDFWVEVMVKHQHIEEQDGSPCHFVDVIST